MPCDPDRCCAWLFLASFCMGTGLLEAVQHVVPLNKEKKITVREQYPCTLADISRCRAAHLSITCSKVLGAACAWQWGACPGAPAQKPSRAAVVSLCSRLTSRWECHRNTQLMRTAAHVHLSASAGSEACVVRLQCLPNLPAGSSRLLIRCRLLLAGWRADFSDSLKQLKRPLERRWLCLRLLP